MSSQSGGSDGGAKPPSGFTFADKRKISPDGPVTNAEVGPETDDSQSAGTEPAGTESISAESISTESAGTEPAQEPDANVELAAERLADLQRLQAEYANYRKRVDRDRSTARDLAIASVVESLLPVLDDIHLARQHGDLESGPFASVAEKLESTLGKYGVERFGEPGAAFDPSIHDALMHVEEELAEGTEVTTVVGVLQPGYRMGDKIIRPARVSVAGPS